jgi:plastocyanin
MRSIQALAIGVVIAVTLSLGAGSHTFASSARVSSQTTSKTIRAATVGGTFAFAPKTMTVKVGTKVTFKDTTGIGHTVTSKTSSWKFNKTLAADGSVKFVFKKAGKYTYYCTIHPWMKGTIVVKH